MGNLRLNLLKQAAKIRKIREILKNQRRKMS
jgi:hypothetical protein